METPRPRLTHNTWAGEQDIHGGHERAGSPRCTGFADTGLIGCNTATVSFEQAQQC
jgi:hypothetical protein